MNGVWLGPRKRPSAAGSAEHRSLASLARTAAGTESRGADHDPDRGQAVVAGKPEPPRRAVAGWVLYDLANTIFSINRRGLAL